MYDVLVIGCGITGAATAFQLSRYKLRVGVLERENDVADGTTKANSAILHAGYDPLPGSLMARLNVRGVALARRLCADLDVPYDPCGSLVLGFTPADRETLAELYRRGTANGVPGLALLTGDEARALEPNLSPEVAAPHTFTIHPSRGQYFLLDKSEGDRAGRVIFQCPNEHGKGVLVAPTVHGNLLVGPNAEPVAGDDTATTAAGLDFVRDTALRSVPSVDFRAVIRSFAGVRAVADTGDFVIEEAAPRFLDLAGICSPGLSAAPAVGEYAVELLGRAGLPLEKKPDFRARRRRVRFHALPEEEKARLVAENPAYGRVICRCETVTEGEILDALRAPIPPRSVDGVKRRVGAGLGRCQGGFCGPRVVELLCRELGCSPGEIVQDRAGSWLLARQTKGGRGDV